MSDDSMERDTRALLVQLLHEQLGSQVELVDTSIAHRREDYVVLLATHTTIPIGEVLAVDVSYRAWPWRYIINTYLPGQAWTVVRSRMNLQELHHAYQQIGEAVAQSHTISFPHFGEVNSSETAPPEVEYLSVLTQRAYERIVSPRLTTLFLHVVDDHLDLFSDICKATLCHGDLHGNNLLFHRVLGRWQLSAILDFDKTRGGPPGIGFSSLGLVDWDGG